MAVPLKLNVGCGFKKLEGYVNVDFEAGCHPDMVHDIRSTPWPFAESSVTEIVISHVLEHVGGTAEEFKAIVREVYRVLAPDGIWKVFVPHPGHDAFPSDPTHVRQITVESFRLLSKKINDRCRETGDGSSQLGYYWDVDFEIVSSRFQLDEYFAEWAKKKSIAIDADSIRFYRNAIKQIYIETRAVKAGSVPPITSG